MVGIFTRLKSCKDPLVIRTLNRYLSCVTRLAIANTEVNFIQDCINNCVYPKSYWKFLKRSRIRPDDRSLKRHSLNRIDSLNSKILELERFVNQHEAVLDELTADERNQFIEFVNTIRNRESSKKLVKLSRTLEESRAYTLFPNQPERYVHNFSSVILDKLLLEALSLGPKFCIPRKKSDQLEVETQFEMFFDQTRQLCPTSDANLEQFKTDLVNISYHYRRSFSSHKSPLTPQHLQALKDLRNRNDILLSRPDKGSGIVILNKTDYIDKMDTILADESKFLKTNEKDCTKKVEAELTNCLKRLRDNGHISITQFDNLKPTGCIIPRLYGLPKIHKENCPLRPILDMCNSPYHAIARWLKDLLKPIQKQLCTHSLVDTFEFVDSIKDSHLINRRMCSLDVSSLFTNVPLFETVDYICDFIRTSAIDLPIPLTDFKELLLRCTFNIQFLFNGTIYRQRDGVAMGSPLGPILADIFVSKLENSILQPIIKELPLYKRYVDDIFIIHNACTSLEELIDCFNNAHAALNFSGDQETDDNFQFLDVELVRRLDGSIQRGIYRKSTWSGQYTNFHSFVPLRYKRNLVKCLAYRAHKICTEDKLTTELRLIRQVLMENGYPEAFLNAHLKCPSRATPMTNPTVGKLPLYLNLPFKGDLATDTLMNRLNKTLRKTFPAAQLRAYFHTAPLLNVNLKDGIPVRDSSMLIYSFTCQCSASYVGRTTRCLSERIREHKPSLKAVTSRHVTSAIAAHLIDNDHLVNFEECFNVVYRIPHYRSKMIRKRALETAEAIAIRLFDPPLCNQKRHVKALKLPWPTNQGSRTS